MPTDSTLVKKVKLWNSNRLFYFSSVTRQKQPKTKTTKSRHKTPHEHNNPTRIVPSNWSTDPEEVSTGYCYFQAVVEEQVWSHPGCLLCSLGLLGGGMTTDATQSSTKASPLESHAAMNICR